LLFTLHGAAQGAIRIKVTDTATGQGIPAVTISQKGKTLAVTDSSGTAFVPLTGNQVFIFSSVGCQQKEVDIIYHGITRLEVFLSEEKKVLEEAIIISSKHKIQAGGYKNFIYF
jgi:hypothetical protein